MVRNLLYMSDYAARSLILSWLSNKTANRLWLSLRGQDGIKEFIRYEFNIKEQKRVKSYAEHP